MLYTVHRDRDGERVTPDNHQIYFACELKKTFVQQLAAVQPPLNDPEADYETWYHHERQHDLFDTHKMALTLHDMAKKSFPGTFWRKGSGEFCRQTKVIKRPRPQRPGPQGRLY